MKTLFLTILLTLSLSGCVGFQVRMLSTEIDGEVMTFLPVCVEASVFLGGNNGLGIGPYILPTAFIFRDSEPKYSALGLFYIRQ